MTPAEQLRAYRSRHVIKAMPYGIASAIHGGHWCAVDGIFLVRGGSHKPWRHDPDEIKRLVKAAQTEALLPSRPDPDAVEVSPGTFLHHGLYLRGTPPAKREPWQRELQVLYEREKWGFRVYSEVLDIVRRAVQTAREEARS